MKVTKKTKRVIRRVANLLEKMYHDNRVILYSTYKFDNNVQMITHSLPFNYESISSDSIANAIIRHINYKNYRYLDEMKHYMEFYNLFAIEIARGAIEADIESLDIRTVENIVANILKIVEETISQYRMPYESEKEFTFLKLVYNSIVSDYTYDVGLFEAFYQTMKYIGSDGFYAMEFSMIEKDIDIVEHIPGYSFYFNGLDQHYITDVQTMEVHLEYPTVALINDNFDSAESLARVMQWSLNTNIPVVIIAKSFGFVVEEMLKINFEKNKTKVYPIVFIHDNSNELFEDMAVLSGAKVLSKETGWNGHLDVMHLGKLDEIMIMPKYCILFPSLNRMDNVLERVTALKRRMPHVDNKEELIRLKERIAKLQGRVAIVSVGGHERYNREYRRDIFRRLVSKMQDVMNTGYLPGEKMIITILIEKLKQVRAQYELLSVEYIILDTIIKALDKVIEYSLNKQEYQALVNKLKRHMKRDTILRFLEHHGIESYSKFLESIRLGIDAGILWLTVATTIKENDDWTP